MSQMLTDTKTTVKADSHMIRMIPNVRKSKKKTEKIQTSKKLKISKKRVASDTESKASTRPGKSPKTAEVWDDMDSKLNQILNIDPAKSLANFTLKQFKSIRG
uniref:Uncharacterized protein n=1 Tax=Euplotes harpa TaxID=151035 RepID=A0A7S3J5F3_9SPIT|mmetsp:Transcript_15904/g.18423  ORF Transcript_15904/g.18423 Transcript_15904/m.18423 type:complete len:103 (+) Transcript_15904:18-326(+)